MKNGCTVNDIKAYIKEFQIQKNIKADGLFVDYLDLMMPVSVKVNTSDQFIKDKFVSEELRNLAIELNNDVWHHLMRPEVIVGLLRIFVVASSDVCTLSSSDKTMISKCCISSFAASHALTANKISPRGFGLSVVMYFISGTSSSFN